MTETKVGDTVRVKPLAEYKYEICERYAGAEGRVVEVTTIHGTAVLVDVGIELYYDINEVEKV